MCLFLIGAPGVINAATSASPFCMRRIQMFLFALAGALALAAAALVWYTTAELGRGTVTQTPLAQIGGPFSLIDQDGHKRTDKDFRGRFVLLYFGYTYCPDVCPTTLQSIADALAKLGPKASRVVPVFVTIDPERDTPAVLKKYAAAFGPRFVALTGSLADIKKLADTYRVYFAKHPLGGDNYSLDHSSIVYLLGPDGKLVTFYDAEATTASMAKDLGSRL